MLSHMLVSPWRKRPGWLSVKNRIPFYSFAHQKKIVLTDRLVDWLFRWFIQSQLDEVLSGFLGSLRRWLSGSLDIVHQCCPLESFARQTMISSTPSSYIYVMVLTNVYQDLGVVSCSKAQGVDERIIDAHHHHHYYYYCYYYYYILDIIIIIITIFWT